MALPFALGLIATAIALLGRHTAALWAWFVFALVMMIFFGLHLTSHINIAL
ncbi:MAG: DUF5993 family protein [Alphaproteobacteria bacterium]|nr:DUF5993 family protein [Alphaproteobacteria bacterium]